MGRLELGETWSWSKRMKSFGTDMTHDLFGENHILGLELILKMLKHFKTKPSQLPYSPISCYTILN